MNVFQRTPGWLIVGLLGLGLYGCAGSKETNGNGEAGDAPQTSSRAPVRTDQVQTDSMVASVQLYRSTATRSGAQLPDQPTEAFLPIMVLSTRETLSLEFDLLENTGRPLTVYFYHADRTWQRDLLPSEYLASFQRDELLDYQSSLGTDVRFAHYEYTFPNENIQFLLSGNYIIRVTEQGQEEDILLERPFFIAEQDVPLQLGFEQILLSDQGGFASVVPTALFTPVRGQEANIYDYSVCFVRNGRFETARCTDRPHLTRPPDLEFYLEPRQAFEPVTDDYFLDLSLLQAGNQIERIDFATSPYEVDLAPDYARFPGSAYAPLYNGQPIISDVVRDVAEPDIAAQYVEVHFSYVPVDQRALEGGVRIIGSFNGWDVDRGIEMEWIAAEEQYVGSALLKQGHYEYRYHTRGTGMTRGTQPRLQNAYSAFVYYRDIRVRTDRLLAFGGIHARP